MAWYSRFFRRRPSPVASPTPESVTASALDDKSDISHTYDDRNITFSGELADYDYEAILRDKQHNIVRLYELADFFCDSEPLVFGIIKGVYAPFSISDYHLVGSDEKTKKKYYDYYERINLKDRLNSIALQYWKYGQCYIYLQDDGNIVTLPVHKTRIANIMINGEPVLEFNAASVRNEVFVQGVPADKLYVNDDDLNVKLFGLPPEVGEAIKRGDEWVQLNPRNTYVVQGLKEDWVRYAVPMIAAMLPGLKKKAKISNYEDSLLDLGSRAFVHVTYGDPKTDRQDMLPNRQELAAVQNVFRQAMRGSALAVTNNWVKAEVIQPKTDELFADDKYKYANSEILSAGGISGIIVSGIAGDGSTFASAQVSINTADKRIEYARRNFCELMNKINVRVTGDQVTHTRSDKIPRFEFEPIDLSGNNKFQKTCEDLWKQGCMSTETMLDAHGINYDQELKRKKQEVESGEYGLMSTLANELAGAVTAQDAINNGTVNPTPTPEPTQTEETEVTEVTEERKVGRPELSDEERTSDVSKAYTGKQPKPSNPEGSLE